MDIQLIFKVVSISAVQQNDSVIHIRVCVCVLFHVLFSIVVCYGLLNIVLCAVGQDFVVYTCCVSNQVKRLGCLIHRLVLPIEHTFPILINQDFLSQERLPLCPDHRRWQEVCAVSSQFRVYGPYYPRYHKPRLMSPGRVPSLTTGSSFSFPLMTELFISQRKRTEAGGQGSHRRGLFKSRLLYSAPRVSVSAGLGGGLRIGISYKFLGEPVTAGPRTIL